LNTDSPTKTNTFLDLTEEMRGILAHFDRADIRFDMLYTGYFGSVEQLRIVADTKSAILRAGGTTLVDPVLGDGGKLYSIYDDAFVCAMREFVSGADLITPNVTEACLLADLPYTGDRYDHEKMETILSRLAELGCRSAVITGVHFGENEIGIVYRNFESGEKFTLASARTDAPLHGTGDVFTSALAGYLLAGFDARAALTRTVSFIAECIDKTEGALPEHWYGVKFEDSLYKITEDIRKKQWEDALLGH
ncbi:MAG: bifunctional hydroxymethylpyrimidine kinase/phosphomethylpyrimidine kinase, partial [Clostridia bacterium]|nr:bifunctional hydroxymethylpyrimidine kinase/phosphomethylpyrimidine kinase [Clostridia bacterium]